MGKLLTIIIKNRKNFFVICSIWFAAIVSLISDSLNQIALYVVLPFAFVLTFLSYGRFKVNEYLNILVLLYMWILISVFWATDTEVAIAQIKQILGAIILCYIFAVKARSETIVKWLYFAYFVLLFFAWYYAYNNIFSLISLGEERVNDEKLNANTLAYYTFYFTFSSYILGEIINKELLRKVMRWVFLSAIPLSYFTAIFTASRQVLILQIPLFIVLLYIRYIKGENRLRKIFFAFSLCICTFFSFPVISQTYNNSFLSERNDADARDDSRTDLAIDAFKVGAAHLPFGVGPGNYMVHSCNKQFSHNTYLELWANEGVVGLFIYLTMLFVFIKRQWMRYKRYKNKLLLSFMVFGVFFAMDGIFYSFYEHLWLIGFFSLVTSHSESYFKRISNINE